MTGPNNTAKPKEATEVAIDAAHEDSGSNNDNSENNNRSYCTPLVVLVLLALIAVIVRFYAFSNVNMKGEARLLDDYVEAVFEKFAISRDHHCNHPACREPRMHNPPSAGHCLQIADGVTAFESQITATNHIQSYGVAIDVFAEEQLAIFAELQLLVLLWLDASEIKTGWFQSKTMSLSVVPQM